MKIWLNEQYAIEKSDGNNLFGKGNDNFDYIEVYIPTAVYEQDNVIPVFIFERSDKKKYGEFAHNVATWQQDGYTVFKHVLNGFVLALKGNLDITIKLNFLKYVDEKRFIEKTKNLYVQGVVLNAIVVENEAFILSNDPDAFLTSLKYLLNDLNARIESGDITANRALSDGNGNVITDTYATKDESKQVLADAKAYGDSVFETKGNVLSKVNTLKTEIQNGTVVANNAKEAVSYRDDENNLVGIKDKIKDILYLINDVTGSDLTGLQSKIKALETAWDNFMHGSESDDIIDTLNEIRNALALKANASDLISHINNTNNPHNTTASQVGAYSTSEVDTKLEEIKQEFEKQIVECNCSHEYEITGFGEEDCNLVIDDQDVVITKIQGQTRRKSLNLLDLTKLKNANKNGVTSYTNDGTTITLNFESGASDPYIEFTDIIELKAGTYTLSFVETNGQMIVLKNITTNIYIGFFHGTSTFTLDSDSEIIFRFDAIENGSVTSATFTKIMLNEGSEVLPYEPYDNTLVNSKCDFVSTGRNLCKSFATDFWKMEINATLKPNTTYTCVCDNNYQLPTLSLMQNGTIIQTLWQDDYSHNTGRFSFTTDSNINGTYTIRCGINSETVNITQIMLNYGDTALPYEPYVEDTMQCGLELGAFDYHDNINHITHRQTSEMITLNGSENWAYEKIINDSYMYSLEISNLNAYSNWDNIIGVANNGYEVIHRDYNYPKSNAINIYPPLNKIYILSPNQATADYFKTWLASNPITFVYKLATETTETNILPSGYKVWYKGMQIQKTDTIPYILTKQYGISLASQVLNNVEVDRSQQKQIDELKTKDIEIKNALKLMGDIITKEVSVKVSGKTSPIADSEGYFVVGGSITILSNSTNKTIKSISISSPSKVSYNSSTGTISYTLRSTTGNKVISATITYTITFNQYLENQSSIETTTASLEE